MQRLSEPVAGDAARLGALIAEHKPAALLLGDPATTPEVLAAAHDAAGIEPPPFLLLMGRLWAERYGQLKDYEQVFRKMQYVQRLPLDGLLCAAYRTGATVDAPGTPT